jgi:hypothetical protein
MLMAGIVSASWLRLVPLRDLDLRLFGTATTRFSELLVRRKLYADHYDNQSSLTQNVRRLTRFCVGREKHTFSLRHPQVRTLNFSARFLYFHLVDRHHIP